MQCWMSVLWTSSMCINHERAGYPPTIQQCVQSSTLCPSVIPLVTVLASRDSQPHPLLYLPTIIESPKGPPYRLLYEHPPEKPTSISVLLQACRRILPSRVFAGTEQHSHSAASHESWARRWPAL